MAWSNSKVFASFVENALARAIAFDLSAASVDTFKAALFDNTITPSNTVAEASARYGAGVWASGEVTSGAQWPTAGVAITGPNLTTSSTTVKWDDDGSNTASSSGATITNAYGVLVYDDTLANDPGVCYNYLGGANSISSGVFTVVWSTSGIASFSVA